ncbi:MAG TPA: glutathione transferase GstA [Nannocystis sp.]|jgi:glutathione S-transferase
MKLYFSPGACSLSPHIALREAGLDFETERVDMATKKTRSGDDFTTINPKGYVPALRLDNGEVLTEGPAIVQYIADLAPEKQLAPAAGTFERVRLQETLNFISTELHKGFSPLFRKDCPEEWKEVVRANLGRRFAALDAQLASQPFLLGEQFTIADGYLFTVLGWTRFVNYDLAPYPNLVAYQARVAARPAVHAALEAEGLIKRGA